MGDHPYVDEGVAIASIPQLFYMATVLPPFSDQCFWPAWAAVIQQLPICYPI
jgi:hypothetical protein